MDPKIKKICDQIKDLQDSYIANLKDKEIPAQEFAHHVRAITCMEMSYNILYAAEYMPTKIDKI